MVFDACPEIVVSRCWEVVTHPAQSGQITPPFNADFNGDQMVMRQALSLQIGQNAQLLS
ncbi:MAG: hypothetical protein LBV12_00495 [Puniceicoccales bacterium]|jgi:DNA-directed RNA polymerase beta' subunit|nr:hypothetical protein [Puniceicoccales bacterium]